MLECAKANASPTDLERFRQVDGYINLDELNIEFTPSSREMMGTEFREKNWIDFNGNKALFKETMMIDDIPNASAYSELIVEKLARQAGIECAHVDLARKDGKSGILSYSILKEGEQLYSLDSFIGETCEHAEYMDIVDLVDMLKKTMDSMKKEGLSKQEIQNMIVDIQKRLAFDMFIGEMDRHTENISILADKDGNLKLAPLYDNEHSLMLDMNNELLEDLARNPIGLRRGMDNVDPKISVIPDTGKQVSLWRYTLDELCGDDDVYEFMMDCYENLDIEQAIEDVEDQIHAKVPDHVRMVATKAFEFRKKEIDKVMCMGYEPEEVGKAI